MVRKSPDWQSSLTLLVPAVGLLLLSALLFSLQADKKDQSSDGPTFLVHTATGKNLRGPLYKMSESWGVEIGKGVRRKIAGADLISLRRTDVLLPALPSEPHLLLAGGDRVPFQDLRLDDEKLYFRHRDLNGNKEVSVPLSSVVLIWRLPPDRSRDPEKYRNRLASGSRARDVVLLRNGDTLEGTLSALGNESVEVEANKKKSSAKWAQVSAIAMSTELADRPRLKGVVARVALTTTEASPGGRFTLDSATSDGNTLSGKTAFGASLSVRLERVASIELVGGKSVPLSSLKPKSYEYRPYLDLKMPWRSGMNVEGHDLRVGGSSYGAGIGTFASSSLKYELDGGGPYSRFEAVVGLDDRDGLKGRARVRVLVDGKAADLGKKSELTHSEGPLVISVNVGKAKELTLEVEDNEDGTVQSVVNWVEARLVK
jgi:hypothetical protein